MDSCACEKQNSALESKDAKLRPTRASSSADAGASQGQSLALSTPVESADLDAAHVLVEPTFNPMGIEAGDGDAQAPTLSCNDSDQLDATSVVLPLQPVRHRAQRRPATCRTLTYFEGVGVKTLIDTGAWRTMVDYSVYDRVRAIKQLKLEKCNFSLQGATGDQLKIYGMLRDLPFVLGGRQFTVDAVVCRVAGVEAILGMDFLNHHHAVVDIGKSTITLSGQKCAVEERPRGENRYPARVAEDVLLPSGATARVPVSHKWTRREQMGLFEPVIVLGDHIMCSPQLVHPKQGKSIVWLENRSRDTITVLKDQILGQVWELAKDQSDQDEAAYFVYQIETHSGGLITEVEPVHPLVTVHQGVCEDHLVQETATAHAVRVKGPPERAPSPRADHAQTKVPSPPKSTVSSKELKEELAQAKHARDAPAVLEQYERLPAHLRCMLPDPLSLSPRQAKLLVSLVCQYQDVFVGPDGKVGYTDLAALEIDTQDAKPTRIPVRRTGYAEKKVIEDTVADLLADGKIRPSQSSWASPVVLVRKKDGSMRFCIDYRSLNAKTRKDAYPLPKIDEALDQLAGSRWWSCLDLASG